MGYKTMIIIQLLLAQKNQFKILETTKIFKMISYNNIIKTINNFVWCYVYKYLYYTILFYWIV